MLELISPCTTATKNAMLNIVIVIFYKYPNYFTFSCNSEGRENEITENSVSCLIKYSSSDYEFVKVNEHGAHI